MLLPHQTQLVLELKKEPTWKLTVLSMITLGIYMAHYIKSRTEIINEKLDKEHKIPARLVQFILFMAYFSTVMIIPYMMVPEGHPFEKVSDALDLTFTISVLAWAFMMRSKLNNLLAAQKGSKEWVHGFWTFFFSGLYINYKINKLSE